MRWCANCVLPDTRPGLVIGDDGVCNACKTHGARKEIDWSERRRSLDTIVGQAHSAGSTYDCVIPVSGGKDSTWQVIQCLDLGLTPLAVTWRPPGRTEIGQANLDNLIRLGVDHIDYSISPSVEAAFMIKAFRRFGSTAIPMHLALFSIPLKVAVRFGIPLVIWGENSAVEYGTTDSSLESYRLDTKWLKAHGVTHGTTAEDWVDDELNAKRLSAYMRPSDSEMEQAGVAAIFLGHFLQWDPETSRKVAAEHGFRSNVGGARTGFYDYADIDDDFISLHHWMKWYKFGFTRLFDNLSLEIRNGRMNRAEAIDIIRTSDTSAPADDVARLCGFTGLARAEFFEIAETFRNQEIWRRNGEGNWSIPGFLIEEWKWS